jgi:hypothetical protein
MGVSAYQDRMAAGVVARTAGQLLDSGTLPDLATERSHRRRGIAAG